MKCPCERFTYCNCPPGKTYCQYETWIKPCLPEQDTEEMSSSVRKLLDNLKRLRGTGSPDTTDALVTLANAVLDQEARLRALESPKQGYNERTGKGEWIVSVWDERLVK